MPEACFIRPRGALLDVSKGVLDGFRRLSRHTGTLKFADTGRLRCHRVEISIGEKLKWRGFFNGGLKLLKWPKVLKVAALKSLKWPAFWRLAADCRCSKAK